MKRVLTVLMTTLIFFTALLPATAAPTSERESGAIYVVQQGDTLYSIAREYGTTVDALREANGLNSDLIWMGQVLVIGSSTGSEQATHTVVRGDTLYSLARRFGTTVDAIMQANQLANTNIYVGQRLLVTTSATPAVGGTAYTVVRGDTLYSIAGRYGTSVEAIVTLNGLSSTSIYVGQQLVISSTKTPLAPTTALPTATATPTGIGTPVASPTGAAFTASPTPTSTPSPTPSLTPIVTLPPSSVIIQSINYDGAVPQSESDEYAIIANVGTSSQNINGWRLYADDEGQVFFFPDFELEPGQSCRVYTNQYHPEFCGFSYERGSAIWNNEGDCGTLFDDGNAEVSRYCYD